MELGKMSTIIETLKEHYCDLSICLAALSYIVAILNLTFFGSPIFIFCGYIGTILLTSGMLTRLGILPTPLRSKSGFTATLTFISGLLLTTAVITFFLDVDIICRFNPYRPITTPPSPLNAGDYFDLPGPEVRPLGGPKTQILRPYAWLFQPLLIASIILFIITIIIEYIE